MLFLLYKTLIHAYCVRVFRDYTPLHQEKFVERFFLPFSLSRIRLHAEEFLFFPGGIAMSFYADHSLRMESRDNILLIHVIGELDHHYCQSARGRIDDLYDQSHALHMVFDFSGLNFMDSSAIGLIMGRWQKASLLGGKVILIHVSPRLHSIFSMAGLYRILEEAPDFEAALALTKGE